MAMLAFALFMQLIEQEIRQRHCLPLLKGKFYIGFDIMDPNFAVWEEVRLSTAEIKGALCNSCWVSIINNSVDVTDNRLDTYIWFL